MAAVLVQDFDEELANPRPPKPDYVPVQASEISIRTVACAGHEERWEVQNRMFLRLAPLALAAVAAACAAAHVARDAAMSGHRQIGADSAAPAILQRWGSTRSVPCGAKEENIEYWVRDRAGVGLYQGVSNPEACQQKCFLYHDCMAWTWMKSGTCTLKAFEQDEQPIKHNNTNATSGGLPCNMADLRAPGTLYCFSLMLPWGGEPSLLSTQFTRKTGIFGCDVYDVYSNESLSVVPQVVSLPINSSLQCEKGGEFKTALNLYIFIAVWQKVVEVGRYQTCSWTVKADPDAVFIPQRLQALLAHHPDEARGVYLNNCKFGMHGPLEVFSRYAVNALARSWQVCQSHFWQVCSGDCKWGEDMFVDQCLSKVAGARRDNEWRLLSEDHCGGNPHDTTSWSFDACNGDFVAFHPFKDTTSYDQCLSNAVASPFAFKAPARAAVPIAQPGGQGTALPPPGTQGTVLPPPGAQGTAMPPPGAQGTALPPPGTPGTAVGAQPMGQSVASYPVLPTATAAAAA